MSDDIPETDNEVSTRTSWNLQNSVKTGQTDLKLTGIKTIKLIENVLNYTCWVDFASNKQLSEKNH